MKSNMILIFSFVFMVFNFKSQEIKNTLPWRKVSIVDSYFGQTKTTYKRQLLQERIFMILLNIVHPPAGGNPIMVIIGSVSYDYLLSPIIFGCIIIISLAILINKFLLKKNYPLK